MFDELLESVKEAKAIKNKELKPSRAFLMREPNPKDIRTKFELTQAHFAVLMNISVHTLRNWEEGRRQLLHIFRPLVLKPYYSHFLLS